MEPTPYDVPLVEAKRTYEDAIPKGSVQAELFWADLPDAQRTLAVRIMNGWDEDIPAFSLSVGNHYAAPQPIGPPSVGVQQVGCSELAFRRLERRETTAGDQPIFFPGESAALALWPQALGALSSRTASLSIDDYWITLRTDGYEFDRIPGATIGAFLADDLPPDSQP